MSNPIAVPGTNVPSGALATPGGAQGLQGLQGPQGPQGGTSGGYTGADSVQVAASTITLVGDVATPSNGQFYGYNGSVRGWSTPAAAPYGAIDSIAIDGSNRFSLVNDVAAPALGQRYKSGVNARGWYNPDFINVLDYGADPSGATDCTTAIQNALNAMNSVSSVVFFPAGIYQVQGLTVNYQGVLLGAGKYRSILKVNNTTNTILNLSVSVTIRELGFGATVSQASAGGWYIGTSGSFMQGLTIDSCDFRDYLHGIVVSNTVGTLITNCSFVSAVGNIGIYVYTPSNTHLAIDNCWFDTGDSTLHSQIAIQVLKVVDLIISNCRGQYMGQCISLNSQQSGVGGAIQQMTIQSCFFQTIGSGVYIYGSSTGSISDVKISNSEFAGIQSAAALYIHSQDSADITEIFCDNCSWYGSGAAALDVIYMDTAGSGQINDVQIRGGSVQGGTNHGIALNPASANKLNYVLIDGVTITSNQGCGVWMGGSYTNNFRIVNSMIAFNNQWGITGVTGAQYFIVMGNNCGGNGSGAINLPSPTAPYVLANNI